MPTTMHSIIYFEPLKIHKAYQGTSLKHMMFKACQHAPLEKNAPLFNQIIFNNYVIIIKKN